MVELGADATLLVECRHDNGHRRRDVSLVDRLTEPAREYPHDDGVAGIHVHEQACGRPECDDSNHAALAWRCGMLLGTPCCHRPDQRCNCSKNQMPAADTSRSSRKKRDTAWDTAFASSMPAARTRAGESSSCSCSRNGPRNHAATGAEKPCFGR